MRRFLAFIGAVQLAVLGAVTVRELWQRWLDAQIDAGLKGRWVE